MSEVINRSLQKIAKGSAIVFIGTIISLVFGFLSRIILVRFTTQEEFGIYSLAFTIVTICVTLSMFGLQDGVARNIGFFMGKKEDKNVQETIYSALIVSLIVSLLVTFIVIISSDYVSMRLFKISEVSFILKLLSISIPFSVVYSVILSILRGFDNARARVIYDYIFRPSSYFLLLGAAVFFKMSFNEITLTYVISIMFTLAVVFVYFIKNCPYKLRFSGMCINKNTKGLMRYSFPLLIVSVLLTVMSWTDTLLLGYFKTAEIVGAYSAIYPIASLLSIGVNSLGYLYVPVISGLYSKNQIKDIKKLNEISTKWNFAISVPIFFLIYVFPELVLNTLYDYRYIGASNVLQILAFGFMMNSLFGLNYYTLIAIGKADFLMICSSISAVLNIILNLILIPTYGMTGAAVASVISFTTIEMYMTLKLYKFTEVHPFSNRYLKIIFVSILSIGIFYVFRSLVITNIWEMMEYYFLFMITYLILIFITKIMDKEDIQILINIKTFLKTLILEIKLSVVSQP